VILLDTKKLAVIGLGYVGLPLALLSARKGYSVIGVDISKEKVDKINKGESPIDDEYIKENLKKTKITATTDFSKIKDHYAIVICVPTPVTKKHVPDMSYVEKACESISKHIQKGQLIILESTVYPGTTEEVCKPILEKSGLKAGTDFYLSHCPERIDPGNKKWVVEKIPRVAGGINAESTKKTAEFYRSVLDSQVMEVKSAKEAEAAKIMENTFRDINIAFMNEMAKSFDKQGIDIMEVIKGASTKPFAFMPHYPGCGVGGHCISVDPYYLIDNAKTYGFEHEFLLLARKINNSMPEYTVELLTEELNKLGKSIKGAKIAVLGLAYKGNVDDIRESPSFEIIELLKKKGASLTVFDPWLPEMSDVKTIEDALKGKECVVLVTDHNQFKEMDLALFKKNNIKLVIDGRNCLDKKAIEAEGIKYKGIGR
jgi:UDP-N-acetyl-D-glucosamine dehydrogenase